MYNYSTLGLLFYNLHYLISFFFSQLVAKQKLGAIINREGISMKKFILPLCLFIFGLAIAHFFFGVDVEGLAEGFIDFLSDILDGPG